MNATEEYEDEIRENYERLAQIPTVIGAYLRANGIVRSTWSQRSIARGKTFKFVKDIFVSNLKKVAESLPLDISTEALSKTSSSEKFRAVIRKNDNKHYLEIWQDDSIIRFIDFTTFNLHGPVYTDEEFSSLEWSPDEEKVLYLAEKKSSKDEEYLYVQDWGEQLVGKKKSILVEFKVEDESFRILEGIPDKVYVAQTKYSPDGEYIVGVAYNTGHRKLGFTCSNRDSTVFKLDFEGNYLELKLDGLSVKSPIFTPDGQSLIWLQRKSGGPHASAMALVKADLPLTKYTVPQVIVDIVEKEIKIHNGDTFYGLYNTGFPERPWASGNRLLLNTNQKYTINSYVIDIESGHVTNLKFIDGSQTVADVYGDTVLAVQSNYFMPDKLVIGKLPRAGSESIISWTDLTATTDLSGPENCIYVYLDLSASSVSDTVRSFNAIYVGPNERTEKYVPLIVWPHDGPHCAFANFWMMEVILFARFGFGILFINYRGSIGSGQSSVEFLLGKIGRSDVADCITAIDKALETLPCLDPYNLALFGGSYGGFLVTHLSGQYPERFNSVVAHNPIIDMASMNLMSHIPDWCYVEVGVEYTQRGKIDNDILIAMRKASPIVHAHKVKAPTLLQIGTKDLRVPSHQGTEYYLRLKANGVHTRMNLYDGDHSLGIASNEDDIVISLLWIMKHEADNFVNGVHRLNLA